METLYNAILGLGAVVIIATFYIVNHYKTPPRH